MKGLLFAIGAVLIVTFVTGSVRADGIAGNGIPDFTYDHITGMVYLDADGLDLNAFTIPAPDPGANHFEQVLDPSPGAGYWMYGYLGGEAQFFDGTFMAGLGVVTDGPYHIMTLDSFLDPGVFGSVYYGTLNSGDGYTNVNHVPEPMTLALRGVGVVAGVVHRRRR